MCITQDLHVHVACAITHSLDKQTVFMILVLYKFMHISFALVIVSVWYAV